MIELSPSIKSGGAGEAGEAGDKKQRSKQPTHLLRASAQNPLLVFSMNFSK